MPVFSFILLILLLIIYLLHPVSFDMRCCNYQIRGSHLFDLLNAGVDFLFGQIVYNKYGVNFHPLRFSIYIWQYTHYYWTLSDLWLIEIHQGCKLFTAL